MCKSAEETINYLLLHCPAAQELWSMEFILFGVSWVTPRGVLDLLAVGKPGLVEAIGWFGMWPLIILSGVYGVREMLGSLKDAQNPFQIITLPSSKLYLSGWMLPLHLLFPLCLRCLIVVCFVLNFGVLLVAPMCFFDEMYSQGCKWSMEEGNRYQIWHCLRRSVFKCCKGDLRRVLIETY